MSDDTSVGNLLVTSGQKYMAKAANLGLDNGITYKI
jgi:hypothetical protein